MLRSLIRSRLVGTALEFALELVRQLYGDEKAQTLTQGMLVSVPSHL